MGGIDYARTNDFVSCFLRFRVGKMHYLIQHTFICAQSRDLPGIKAPLREWEAKGDVEFVYDVEIPAALVAEWFAAQAKRYQVLTIAIDSFRFSLALPRPAQRGLRCQGSEEHLAGAPQRPAKGVPSH